MRRSDIIRCCCVRSLSNNLFSYNFIVFVTVCLSGFISSLISLSFFFSRSYFHFFFLSKAFSVDECDFSTGSKSHFSALEVTFHNKMLEVYVSTDY